jgi:hypothetical protein
MDPSIRNQNQNTCPLLPHYQFETKMPENFKQVRKGKICFYPYKILLR